VARRYPGVITAKNSISWCGYLPSGTYVVAGAGDDTASVSASTSLDVVRVSTAASGFIQYAGSGSSTSTGGGVYRVNWGSVHPDSQDTGFALLSGDTLVSVPGAGLYAVTCWAMYSDTPPGSFHLIVNTATTGAAALLYSDAADGERVVARDYTSFTPLLQWTGWFPGSSTVTCVSLQSTSPYSVATGLSIVKVTGTSVPNFSVRHQVGHH
jgi:hypothetical protein